LKRLIFSISETEANEATTSPWPLRGVYTGEKTFHIVAVDSDGNLKRWEDFD
jgi:hypothetical protein